MAIVAGTGKHQKLVLLVLAFERKSQLEAGVAQVGWHQSFDFCIGVGELVLGKGQRFDTLLIDDMNLNRVAVEQPAGYGHDLKG